MQIYAEYNDSWQNLMSLWNLFEISELTEVMRQRGDGNFIDLFNHVRIAELNDSNVSFLDQNSLSRMTNTLKIHFIYLQKMHLHICLILLCSTQLKISYTK